jgi:ribosome-binding protein aMBF1 (putative translation factor)
MKALSLGRVALLGIAQKQIRTSRAHISTDRYRRKPLPTSIKTLGDLIQIKRFEKRLTLWQLAQKMGIATATVRRWEGGTDQPNKQQMELLTKLLGICCGSDLHVYFRKGLNTVALNIDIPFRFYSRLVEG